jgi:hypothetical protein
MHFCWRVPPVGFLENSSVLPARRAWTPVEKKGSSMNICILSIVIEGEQTVPLARNAGH